MKILGFADFHGNTNSVRKASHLVSVERPDVVIVAGDLANRSMQRAEHVLRELSKFNSKVLFVPGNMDDPALANWEDDDLAICLHGRRVAQGEVCFMGLGGAVTSPFRASFEFEETEADEILSRTVGDHTSQFAVFVSHCPPKDTKLDLAAGRWHVGSETVRRFIEESSPELVICGHIHEAQGTDLIGNTQIVNVGAAAHGQCASISLVESVKIELRRF